MTNLWRVSEIAKQPGVTIKDVRAICTAPAGIRLVIVRVETSEHGLYGLGCATFTQRPLAVVTAVDEYLKPFLVGRDVDQIEDIWQAATLSSYWRSGPVLNNALSGVDQALWDIKAKRLGVPLYQLFGGKCRRAADLYVHATGWDMKSLEDSVRKYMEAGFRYVRCQMDVAGYATYGVPKKPGSSGGSTASTTSYRLAMQQDPWEPRPYALMVPRMFEHIRNSVGDDVELLHDVHERVPPIMAVQLAKDLEPYHLFFLEDAFAPEDQDYLRLLRSQTSVPIALGELYVNPHEYVPVVRDRLIDFMRVHISDIGGLTPARKLAALCEFFGVRTAWHGPGTYRQSATRPTFSWTWPARTSGSRKLTCSTTPLAKCSLAAPRYEMVRSGPTSNRASASTSMNGRRRVTPSLSTLSTAHGWKSVAPTGR